MGFLLEYLRSSSAEGGDTVTLGVVAVEPLGAFRQELLAIATRAATAHDEIVPWPTLMVSSSLV